MSTEERWAKMNLMWPQPSLPPIPLAASLLHAPWGQVWSVLWMTHEKGSYASQSCSSSVACILKCHFPLLPSPGPWLPLQHLTCKFISHYSPSQIYFTLCVHVWLFVTSWTVAHQAPLSMEFSRQEYWSGLPFLSPGDLPSPGIEPPSLASPALASRFFTTSAISSKFNLTSPCHIPYSSWSIRFKPISQTLLLLFYPPAPHHPTGELSSLLFTSFPCLIHFENSLSYIWISN